eukprot:2616402-Karenia_brevis.AAC.1
MAVVVHPKIQHLVKQVKYSNRCIRVDINNIPSKFGNSNNACIPSDGPLAFSVVGVHQAHGDAQEWCHG